ncbi:nuclear transport factor 2 family protein [Dongia rigui]|uniref:Nuclear transport factor 2 family protein n=1 Tax=Dongia rigui TaxID=940149 RepID=A0ABU5E176_9PROT|nr:nuclear transport factor 2 family protein [Dongia rigui]MDY0873362.1 nuclear transport factor 2 family protein [Dongia rigui]
MNEPILDAYLALWADPSPERDLDRLDALTTLDVRFKDPINDLTGRDDLKHIFRDSADAVATPQVEVIAIAWAAPDQAFVKWRYSGLLRRLGNRPWSVVGMSDIRFSADGRISFHEDHWDLASGLFEYFPLIGGLFRRLRHRLRLRPEKR